jgi:hypothetical protein
MIPRPSRRSVLRGLLNGAAVAVALPVLDCMLNDSGTAWASGRPLPVRFGTWFWGCGMNPRRWNPAETGADWQLSPELQAIQPVRRHVSVLSGFNVLTDGRPNHVHNTGWIGVRTGTAPLKKDDIDSPTLDVLVADSIGAGTRFRALDVTATGNPSYSYSLRSTGRLNPAEPSPLAFYARLFGPEFQDPNAAGFTPDPRVMVDRSVLSGIADERQALLRQVGAADRARLDDYFTSVRQLETQLGLQLEKPAPAEACRIPGKPGEAPEGQEIGQTRANHTALTRLLVMALACNQTRVFNMVFSDSSSNLRRSGNSTTHHILTHEEPVDRELGYQPEATWFHLQAIEAWTEFVTALAEVREGAGTLLDNCAVMAHSDCSLAKVHDQVGTPVMIAGAAGGRLRPGIHVRGNGDPVTRIGLTLQQVMGLAVDRWGSGSMQTDRAVGEILA